MIEDEIARRVAAHYDRGDDVLMLSDLGAALRAGALWPPEGETRSLAEAAEATPGITLVRDPAHSAFIVAVPAGREELAHVAIRRKANARLLRRLPRSILIAFCVDGGADAPIYIRPEPPFRYVTGPAPSVDGYLPLEPQFRMPGLFVENVAALQPDEANELAEKVRAWCDEHQIALEDLTRFSQKPSRPEPRPLHSAPAVASSALERLLAAQSPEVAARLSVPIDIALLLSRMP